MDIVLEKEEFDFTSRKKIKRELCLILNYRYL